MVNNKQKQIEHINKLTELHLEISSRYNCVNNSMLGKLKERISDEINLGLSVVNTHINSEEILLSLNKRYSEITDMLRNDHLPTNKPVEVNKSNVKSDVNSSLETYSRNTDNVHERYPDIKLPMNKQKIFRRLIKSGHNDLNNDNNSQPKSNVVSDNTCEKEPGPNECPSVNIDGIMERLKDNMSNDRFMSNEVRYYNDRHTTHRVVNKCRPDIYSDTVFNHNKENPSHVKEHNDVNITINITL